MFKRFIASAFIVLSFLSFAPVASAQVYGTYAYCNGAWYMGSCNGRIATSGAPVGQLIPVNGHPGMFNAGGNQYRCSALAGWTGGLIGAGIGYLIGKNVTVSGHRLSGGGAVVGALAGNQIACELATPNVMHAGVRGVGPSIPAELAVGGEHGSMVHGQRQRPRTITEPSDCDIEGRPELQNLRITHDQCKAIRSALTVKEPSDCDVGAAKDMKGLSQAQCDAIRASMTVKRDGHCMVGGVSYPHLVDNEPGCLAMRGQVKQAAIEKAKPHSYGKVAEAARNAQGYPCFVGSKDGDLLADFMVLDKNPYGEIATTGPKCKALVERFRTENGGTIAQN